MVKRELERTVEIGEGDNKKEVTVVVKQPPNSVVKAAERHKSKVWNEAIQDGVLTKKELATVMQKRGIWDKTKSDREAKIQEEIVQLERYLYQGKGGKKPKVSEGRDIAIEIRKKRIELRNLISERISLEENTADSLADNARFDYLVAHCSFYKDGRRIYKDFDEYNSKSTDELAFTAAQLLGEMLYDLDASFEKNLPENVFLSKFNLVNDDLRLVDPNEPEYLVDTKGRRIDEEGYLLNDDGKRVDQDGNLLNEKGEYEMVEYENDLIKKPKRTTRKQKEAEDISES